MANISRRQAALTAALIPYHAVGGTAANKAITIGLIGSGSRGTNDARTLSKDPRARIVALCDIFDDRIERARGLIPAPDAKAFKNYQDLLATDVDAVVIATPVFLHPEHFEAAVRAGKHIYIEKPAGADVAGCKRVMQAADRADRKLNITFGFQQRYAPVYRKAKQFLDSGAIGTVRAVYAQFIKGSVTADGTAPSAPRTEEEKIRQWSLWRDMSGDIIVETYCHNMDAINWFLGNHPIKALGSGGRTVEKRGDNLDHLDVIFDYPGNVQVAFQGAGLAPKFYRSYNERFLGATGVIETAREYWAYDVGKGPVTEKSAREITIDSLQEFLRRVAEGKPENTGVRSAESTLTSILGRMAIDARREVTWDDMMNS